MLRPGFEPGICDSKGHNAWPYCAVGMNQLLHHRSNRQVIQILGHKIFSWIEKNENFKIKIVLQDRRIEMYFVILLMM